MAWTKAFNSQGPSGAQLRTGSGSPAASLGAVGDTYIDITSTGAPIFYGAKTASGWPSSGTSLVGAIGNPGAAGSQITYGTAVPGPPYTGHAVGDVYLRSTGDLYQLTTNGWVLAFSLLGPVGPQGVSVRSGSGAPSSSLGNVGDVYVDTTGSNLYGSKTASGWPTTYTSLTGLTGASGGVIRSGSGAPASSLGNVGDVYIDLTVNAVTLYGNKTASGWPSSGTSLVGTAGLSVLTGSGAPSSSLGVQTQAYVDTTNAVLYVKGASTWSTGVSIVGLQGVQGLSVLTGSGAPSSSIGATNQAYLDYTNSIIYVRTSSGWPTTGTSLVGIQGPASPSIVSGSGAPTASAVAGSFYIRTDTTPNYLYGPYTTASGWPTSYTAMGGGSFQTTSGPPASSLGSIGDCAFDLTNALFYPPKTSSGWTATPINMVGPTGAPGVIRAQTKGYVWLNSSGYATANAAVAVNVAIVQGSTASLVPLLEPMFTAGQIVAVGVSCPGSVTACNGTVNVLKNGATLCTFSNVIACNSSATPTTGYARASNTYTFAAGDALTMTASFSASGGQCINITLYYQQNA
jgi:hypothetical protein